MDELCEQMNECSLQTSTVTIQNGYILCKICLQNLVEQTRTDKHVFLYCSDCNGYYCMCNKCLTKKVYNFCKAEYIHDEIGFFELNSYFYSQSMLPALFTRYIKWSCEMCDSL